MDDLVLDDSLVGSHLVQTIALAMPGSNISVILDKTTDILNKRIIAKLKPADTVFHLIEDILSHGPSDENALKMLDILSTTHELQYEIKSFLCSGLFNSISKFIAREKEEQPACILFRGRRSSSKK
jgi:hypothetical protein